MTCNPNWPEIKENLRPGEKASDRPDVVAHVFMQKLKTLNKDLDEGLLGVVAARIHVVEYQKRGLPHAHILLIMRPEEKPVTAEDVDRLTSAELPDKETHPELYETFAEETIMVEDKYPTYRRRCRPEGILSHKRKVWDNAKINQWVVPYNPFLSQKYDCHINVEVCATNKAVKYIYKYVYKGSDMTTITIEGEEIQANEILQYLLGRYISPKDLSEDFFGSIQKRDAQNNIDRDEEVSWRMAEHKCLMWLADYLISNGKTLSMYGLPDLETYSDVSDEVARQSADPMDIVAQKVAASEPDDLERTATLADQMKANQKDISDQDIEAVNRPVGGQKLFFVDGQGDLVNRSCWSRYLFMFVYKERIPLKLSEFSTCSLSWQSQKAELIRKGSLIIRDEAPMMHRACFEAVDRSFRDIMKNELEPFGGPFKGKQVFIPRIIFYNEDDDKEFPFKLRRKQFPVVPSFAMTINKAQGQSIHHVGFYLESPVFAHGQLYVALSRVTSRKAVKIAVYP
ncbi:Helitron helicase-like protein [Phytophthora palmivora]|uniref:ATP-dependent DNA helicase n=1 Tax=Phytophthora palmivora TaxID=4796 RepID=A0A2P4XW38_9STRA|nr:Helitron helicase-like protein [Phytophthora palmivora]